MSIIYKTLPISIIMVIAGYFVGIANSGNAWKYLGIALIVAALLLMLGVSLIVTCIHWRRDKASKDKKFSEVSVTLIFNAVVALLLFAYVTWKDIVILSDDNLFLILWMAINLGALRTLWVPKESESKPEVKRDETKEEKKEEAV